MKTKSKKKQAANQGLVPKLRFPEFQDAGDWKREVLGFYLEQYSEKVPSSTDLDVYSSTRDGLKPQNEYYNGQQLVNDGEYGTVPNGYFVYRHMSDDDTFKFNINTFGKKIAVSKEYPVFKTVNIVSEFLVNKLNEEIEFKRFAARQKKGGTRTRLYFKTLCSFECSLPSFEEQQKIASCLSSLDELIAAQADKLDTLKAHKKGLMQQLFPAHGQATPTLRFPEFQDAGEWEEQNGNLLFEQISNKQHNSDLPVLAITQENGAIPREMINYHVSVTSKSIESYKVVEVGDFIISLRSFQGGIEYSEYKGICSPAYIILRKKKSMIHSQFFKHFFKSERYIQLLNRNIEGLRDGKMVSYKQFSTILLPLPSPAEQKKIADCLSSLDELIAAQADKLDTLKTHKKGLMQKLFPNIDEANV